MDRLLGKVRLVAKWFAFTTACLSAGVQAQTKTVTYYYTDSLGSVLAAADAAGNITSQSEYRPFGQTSLGGQPDEPGFTGHIGDSEAGLIYMQARYYDPSVGRFLSIDPVAPTAGDVFNGNRFAYVNDNPVRYSDPTGKCIPCAAPFVEAGAAVVVAAGAAYATHLIIEQVNSQQPVIVVQNEATSSPEAKDKIFDGTAPAAGKSGVKGEREGAPGGETAAWDKIDGNEKTAPNGTKLKELADGGVADLHSSTKSQDYPQGTPTIKITDPNNKIIGTVRYPAPPPPPPPKPET
jgi:RHS repeat-associated protein